MLRYLSDKSMPASGAYVGLALPGELGSWQTESKVQQHSENLIYSSYLLADGFNLFTFNLFK